MSWDWTLCSNSGALAAKRAILTNGVSTTLQYDSLNRLTSGHQAVSSGWGQQFTYDAWGNLYNIAVTQGSATGLSCSADPATNQLLSCFGYDTAGNLTNNGGVQYVYDAENRISSTNGGASYTYDAGGQRVAKGATGTTYFHFGGQPVAEYNNGIWSDYVFAGSKRIAVSTSAGPQDPNGLQAAATTNYYYEDQIGSSRMMTTGTILTDGTTPSYASYAPYGQLASGSVPSHYMFTGKERDSETGLDYFGARYYGSNMGRFMSPDWSASAEPVPYANLAKP